MSTLLDPPVEAEFQPIVYPNGTRVHSVFVNERGTQIARKTCTRCDKGFEVRLKQAPRVSNCDDCREWKIPGANGGFVFAVAQVHPILEEILARRDAAARHQNGEDSDIPTGSTYSLAEDIASVLSRPGQPPVGREATVRRLFAIRKRESKVVNTEFVDAMLLAEGRFLHEEPRLKTFPAGKTSAREMVVIKAEDDGVILDDLEIQRRARQLMEDATKEVLQLDGDYDPVAA